MHIQHTAGEPILSDSLVIHRTFSVKYLVSAHTAKVRQACRAPVWVTHRQLYCVLAAGRWFGAEWVPTEDSTKEHLPFLASVATFLSRVAQHQYAQRQLAADKATSGKDVGSAPSWEAPSQSEWVTILRTSQLLLLTLAWLLDPAKTEPFMHGKDAHMQRLQLEKALWGILHGVLIGHLHNHDLKLENIALYMLEAATHALGRKGMASHQPLMELLRALLTRLARDTKLTEETRGRSQHGQSYLLKPLWGLMGMLLPFMLWSPTWCAI